jgi:poly(beta-D-mannuronate) lyase
MRTTWKSAITLAAGASFLAGSAGCLDDARAVPSSVPTSAASAPASGAAPPEHVTDAASALKSPFDVEARRKIAGVAMPDPRPEPLVPPVRDLIGVSFYVDKTHSLVDPVKKRENEAAVAPVRQFVASVTTLADGWMRSSPAKPDYAKAALDQLFAWASAGALLGEVNQQGGYERKWTLGSLALAFLKVRAAPGLDPGKVAATQAWFSRVAAAVMPAYEDAKNSSSRNNHAYWAGLAVAAAGVATNDRRLFDWGMSRARMGIAAIRADGTLPLEMERARLALHYHAFALPPLVMLAEMAAANGIALYDEDNGALRRLADRVMAGMDDPRSFEKLAGVAQAFPLTTHPRASYVAWGEAYYARLHDPRLLKWLGSGARPLVDERLGGDQTLSFGVTPLPPAP